MQRRIIATLVALTIISIWPITAPAGDITPDLYKVAYRKAKKSVIGIRAVQVGNPLEKKAYANIAGSGVIWSKDGLVITNKHVAERTRDIKIILYDNRELSAQVLKMAGDIDLAILRITDPPSDLEAIVPGDSDALESGEIVLAIGNPGGLTHTLTQGIVSATGRQLSDPETGVIVPHTFIQTDAAINPGNSGGALINLRGELLGIPTLVNANFQNIGFAIPVNVVKTVIPQLLANDTPANGWLGISVQELTPDLRSATSLSPNINGVVVTKIDPRSPARQILQQLDVITHIDGKATLLKSDLEWVVRNTSPGTKLKISIFRSSTKKTLELVVEVISTPAK